MAKKKKINQQKKRKRKNLQSYDFQTLTDYTYSIFARNPVKSYNYKQIAKRLGVKDSNTRQQILKVLSNLEDTGKLEEVRTGKYKLKSKGGNIVGTMDMSRKATAFVNSDEIPEEVFIARDNLNHALHGDEVKVYVFARRRKRRLQGEVVEIIRRSKNRFVGKMEVSRNYAFMVPDSITMPYDVFIPIDKLNNAKNGQKAIVEIAEWPKQAKNPIGEVVEVLGDPGDNEVEMHAILAEFGLPLRFPEFVNELAEKIPTEITDSEIKKRRDFRKITTFTIDPEDAKDFDDALSLRKLKNGNVEVGIHIADVTHYVKADSIIDQHGYERGTSVYLVDRVVPMLPEKLSNMVCSLRPDETKLTYSAVFEMTAEAQVKNEWFGRTVINSDRRFTYEEAQNIIETGEGDFSEEILLLNKMAKQLRKKRFDNGAINFERSEVKFKLDEKSQPVSVFFREMQDANHLIEEFMLLANRKVAEFVARKNKTFVYRVHDEPDSEKLHTFSNFIRQFGYKLKHGSPKNISTSINRILDEVSGKTEEHLIEELAIRSMAKAVYSTDNIGHYGLSFEHYTHFTSPIRRYPDVMVHRLLTQYLNKEKQADKTQYEKMCRHSSDMERRAVAAERASIKYKQVEFMQDKLGNVYDGVISGVTEWGLYVEIVENKVEGMILLKDLDDDYYELDEESYSIVGHHTGNAYQLGEKVKIQVVRANLERKQLDFVLYDEDE